MLGIEVRQSFIHGKGVYATQNFEVGDVVIPWELETLSQREYDLLQAEEKKHTMWLDNSFQKVLPPACYVNHSCDSNTKPIGRADVAIKPIKIGDEITADYAPILGPDEEFTCSCGSLNCRKIVKQN